MRPNATDPAAPLDTGFTLPAGFKPHFRRSPLTNAWEPIYSKREPKKVIIGLLARAELCNALGTVHGGVIVAMSDEAMGLNCGIALVAGGWNPQHGLVTISLNVDFIRPAQLGQWLSFDASYVKVGKTVCFAQVFASADNEVVARASATFKSL